MSNVVITRYIYQFGGDFRSINYDLENRVGQIAKVIKPGMFSSGIYLLEFPDGHILWVEGLYFRPADLRDYIRQVQGEYHEVS